MMSKGKYNEIWERKKRYLIRSLFQDLPDFSTIPEEFYSSEASTSSPRTNGSPSPRFNRSPSPFFPRTPKHPHRRRNSRSSLQSPGRYSPLPPLIIEREPNKHDEPEEYYIRLERKVKKIYRKLFLNGDTSISSVGNVTMEDEEIGNDLDNNYLNEKIAGDYHFSIDDDDGVEVSFDRQSTTEKHYEAIKNDSPNGQEVSLESDEWTTIDEEVIDNDHSSDTEQYTGDRVRQNGDHLLQLDAKVSESRQASKELTGDIFCLKRPNLEIADHRHTHEKTTGTNFSLNRQNHLGVIYEYHSPKDGTLDRLSLNRQDEVMIHDHHSPEVTVDHQDTQQELVDNLENVDMSLTLNDRETLQKNADNESSTDIEAKSVTYSEDHESNTMSLVEDRVPGSPDSEDNEVSVNLEGNRVSDAAHQTENIEVMRTPRHQSPCSPRAANPFQSFENSLHFCPELSIHDSISELDKSNPFDILRLSSPKNYFENLNTNFGSTRSSLENLNEDSNSHTNFENIDERYRVSNVGIQTIDHVEYNVNILNDNIFIGTPRVFKLCSCTNHVCGN